MIDVTRVALDAQAEILAQLQGCLEEGFEFSDADGNGQIEGDKQFDWDDERAFCAESAQSDFRQADLQTEIQMANAEQVELQSRRDAANARIDEANAAINDLTPGAMDEIRREGL